MILIDTNSLIVIIIGLIDPRIFKWHNRTSIYTEEDFYELMKIIGGLDKLIVLPNVWTEVDNLLNDFRGDYKYQYILKITETIKASTEKFIDSHNATQNPHFQELGLTDSLILEYSKECELLITSDSRLSDYANAFNIPVHDMVKRRNERL